jgi:hypothetical protein
MKIKTVKGLRKSMDQIKNDMDITFNKKKNKFNYNKEYKIDD